MSQHPNNIIGLVNSGLIITQKEDNCSILSIVEFGKNNNNQCTNSSSSHPPPFVLRIPFKNNTKENSNVIVKNEEEICHASIQTSEIPSSSSLDDTKLKHNDTTTTTTNPNLPVDKFWLIGIVRRHFNVITPLKNDSSQTVQVDNVSQKIVPQYSTSILLVKPKRRTWDEETTTTATRTLQDNEEKENEKKKEKNVNLQELEIVEEVPIVESQDKELRIHLLSCINKDDAYPQHEDSSNFHLNRFKYQLIVLTMNECVMVYTIEALPSCASEAHIEILSSECATRSFWWCQYVPELKFLAFAHTRRLQQCSFDDDYDDDGSIHNKKAKPVLSVLQFHDKFPRESVLNMPLKIESYPDVIQSSSLSLCKKNPLIHGPNVFCSSEDIGLKILAHSHSGAVYLFHMHSNQSNNEKDFLISTKVKVEYTISLLHHNTNLNVQTNVGSDEFDLLKVDVCLYSHGQYLLVVGWPFFVHLLDVGIAHEPSHHLILDLKSLLSPNLSFISINTSFQETVNNTNTPTMPVNDRVKFIFQDFSYIEIEFNSALLIPLIKSHEKDINFILATLHLLLIHLGDVNAAKRIVYDMGKNVENLHLKKIFQEFLVDSSYLQTKKQLASNLEAFLHLIPYCPFQVKDIETENIIIRSQPNSSELTTMLLSPRQRVFPHNITDTWTSLWERNRERSGKQTRFSHKKIAEKLLLTLQCYKPEVLSRASTPMSPSSPMICVTDIAGMFSRRMQELQLPFLEHESCTANKQEYIFSINLRELSMHLLKEQKELPLHGHTVAGKMLYPNTGLIAGKYCNALVDTARLLCHLICLSVQLQPTKNRDKGFRLIDSLDWETKLKLFMLFEHYSLALGELACPLPNGFTSFFSYLGYRVVPFDQFLWHARSGSFDLQIDLVKAVMADLNDSDEENVRKKLQLISLLPKSRANRVLNGWSHPLCIGLRARQHASDLLSGVQPSHTRRPGFVSRKKKGIDFPSQNGASPLDLFFKLLTHKASIADIDLGLLTEATMLSFERQNSDEVEYV